MDKPLLVLLAPLLLQAWQMAAVIVAERSLPPLLMAPVTPMVMQTRVLSCEGMFVPQSAAA